MKIEEFVKELVEILSTTQCFDCQTEDCGGCENVKDCPYYTEEVTIEKKTNEKKTNK